MERMLVHLGNNICRRTCGNAYGKLIHMIVGIAYEEDVSTINTEKQEYRLIASYAAKWIS